MKEIIKGGAYRLLYMLFNFGIGLLIAYLSGTELFGLISLMIVNASIFHIISGLGTDSSIVWHGAKKNTSVDQLMTFTFSTALLQILVFIIFTSLWLYFTGKTMLTGSIDFQVFLLELLYFMGLVWLEKYISVWYANQMSMVCNRIILFIIFILFLILLPLYFGLNIFNLDPFTFFCFLPIVQAIPLIFYFHKKKPWRFTSKSNLDLQSLLSFSFIVFITNTIQFLAYRIDYWIINHYHDVSEVGVYAQANRFAQLIWVIPNIMAALMIPLIASPDSTFSKTDFSALIRGIIYVSLIMVFGVGILSYLLYMYFLPVDYLNGFKALLIMIPGFYFFILTILLAAWFSAQRILWINFWGSLICLAFIFITDIILIPSIGINGAALGNSIGYSTSALFSIYMFLKLSSFKIHDLFIVQKNDFRKLLKWKFNNEK